MGIRGAMILGLVLALGAPPSAQPSVPTPKSVIGWDPCADYKLATCEQIEQYFRKLAAAVPARIKLVEMGKTTEGRAQVMGIISSEQNIRQLDRYKEISRSLALARRGDRLLTDDQARALAREGKTVVWIYRSTTTVVAVNGVEWPAGTFLVRDVGLLFNSILVAAAGT